MAPASVRRPWLFVTQSPGPVGDGAAEPAGGGGGSGAMPAQWYSGGLQRLRLHHLSPLWGTGCRCFISAVDLRLNPEVAQGSGGLH